MLQRLKELRGYTLRATDGEIGRLGDFLFEDIAWIIRYLVADTGDWLGERQVLLPPAAIGLPDWESQALPIALKRDQVAQSPPISSDQPVSRQMENELHEYYKWVPYWQSVVPLPDADFFEADLAEEPEDDLHLRSADEVTGYHIHAADGDVGHLEDLIADDEAWLVRYLVVDTGDWLPGRKVLLAPALVQSIDWVNRMIYVDVERDSVEQCPEYDPEAPVDREYEVQLYEHYGRPHYWL
jgi:hypothetical protein